MELKAYVSILWQRWYLVTLVPALVVAGVVYQALNSNPIYTASTGLSVLRLSEQPELEERFRYESYYRYLSSEFAVDDLVEVVKGNVFAAEVAKALRERHQINISDGEVHGAITAERRHRILTINASSADPERAKLIARVAGEELAILGTTFFGDSPEGSSNVTVIQQPESAASNANRQRLLFILQIVVAVFGGIVLAFLIDYLDDTLRSPDMVTVALGLPVVGMIPSERGAR